MTDRFCYYVSMQSLNRILIKKLLITLFTEAGVTDGRPREPGSPCPCPGRPLRAPDSGAVRSDPAASGWRVPPRIRLHQNRGRGAGSATGLRNRVRNISLRYWYHSSTFHFSRLIWTRCRRRRTLMSSRQSSRARGSGLGGRRSRSSGRPTGSTRPTTWPRTRAAGTPETILFSKCVNRMSASRNTPDFCLGGMQDCFTSC